MAKDPLAVYRRLREITDSIAVGVSCGKDSVVVLDLARSMKFHRVACYFYYLVSGLSFQERYLCFLEKKYSVDILRLPHWQLGEMLQGTFRPVPAQVAKCKVGDAESYVRKKLGIQWIATGERFSESLERRANIQNTQGISHRSRRAYPIGFWTKAMVDSYLKRESIPLSSEYRLLNQSFGRLYGPELEAIKNSWPADYEKILRVFPHAEVAVKRQEFTRTRKTASIRDSADSEKSD